MKKYLVNREDDRGSKPSYRMEDENKSKLSENFGNFKILFSVLNLYP